MQKMKARVRPEAVDRIADLSKKRSKVVVHTTSTPQHQTIRKEDMTSLDMYFSVQYSDTKGGGAHYFDFTVLDDTKRTDENCGRCNSVFNFRQTFRIVLLKSRFEDTIFKTQQEMKASLDTQGFDLKNSVGSKRRPETVYRVGDSSKKRLKVAVHTTPTPRCPTVPKEETRTVGTYCFQFNIQPLNNFLLF
ncbi:hypothetical protein V6N12_070403 [Hibiscus sabdariffa]|uniref:Uncharacterized protein n=1 Tax=Hibiscus sabdariffa TaxID=183260 RepID=A0ABR2FHA8_9ROSI